MGTMQIIVLSALLAGCAASPYKDCRVQGGHFTNDPQSKFEGPYEPTVIHFPCWFESRHDVMNVNIDQRKEQR